MQGPQQPGWPPAKAGMGNIFDLVDQMTKNPSAFAAAISGAGIMRWADRVERITFTGKEAEAIGRAERGAIGQARGREEGK